MARFTRQLVLPYRPTDVYELVSDIGRYPEFIRWIQSMAVSDVHTQNGVDRCLGEARVGFRGFSERFATQVAANPADLSVRASLVRGPFRYLENLWQITALANGQTRVDITLDYEFRNLVLKLLAKNNMDLAVRKLMDAFISEAGRRYARVPATG